MPGPLAGLSRAELCRLYFDEKLSQWQIAERFGVTQGAIFYWFKKHKIRARSHDDSLILLGKSGRFTGAKNPRWTGGRHINVQGYVMLRMPAHPRADNRGYVREHIYVWEKANGPLPKGWHIHHKNGKKTDNRLKNLEALTREAHALLIPRLQKRIAELTQQLEEANRELKRLRPNPKRRFHLHS
jgi:hypothetical protein